MRKIKLLNGESKIASFFLRMVHPFQWSNQTMQLQGTRRLLTKEGFLSCNIGAGIPSFHSFVSTGECPPLGCKEIFMQMRASLHSLCHHPWR